jgi:hypothetical protein
MTSVLAQSSYNKHMSPHIYRKKNSDYSILSSADLHFNPNYFQQSCFYLFCISVKERMTEIAEDTTQPLIIWQLKYHFINIKKEFKKKNEYSWTVLMHHSLLNAEQGLRMQWDRGTLQNYSIILHQLTKEFELNHVFADDVDHHCESKPQCFQEISLLHMWSINHSITWKMNIMLTYNYLKTAVPSTQTVKHI